MSGSKYFVMKTRKFYLLVLLFLLGGCQYEAPLTEEHDIPLDPAVLGAWKYVPGDDEDPATDAGLLVMEFSDTEYLIYYHEDDGGLYIRAYGIKIGDIPAVQLKIIGDEGGPIKNDDWEIYNVASYRLINGELEVSTLNTALVDDDLTDSESIRQAFLKHKDDPELFTDPGKFRRVKD